MQTWIVWTLLAACTGPVHDGGDGSPDPTTEPEPLATEDLRLDGANDSDDVDSFGTKMCVTELGHVYVLWMDNRIDTSRDRVDIWLNRSDDRGEADSWLPAPVKVNQGDGNVWNPDLHCNDLGVFVVWEDNRDGELENHQIYFNRSADGGETFLDTDILVETDPDGASMSLEPKITGTDQDLFVVWYDNLNGAYDILVNSSGDAGVTWRDPVRVDSDLAGSGYSARPTLAASDNAQHVWVAWEDARDGRADVYFARSDAGGLTFEPDLRLDVGDAAGGWDSFEPRLCADGGSHVYAVWHDARNGEGRDVLFNYSSDAGDTWMSAAGRLDSDPAGLSNSLYPACVAQGATAHIAWQDNRNDAYDIYYRDISDGIPGAEEQRVNPGTGLADSVDTRIASDAGTTMVAWIDVRDDDDDDLSYNVSDGGPFQETGYRIDTMNDGQSSKVDLNIDVLGGEGYTSWTEVRGGSSDVYFRRLLLGEA